MNPDFVFKTVNFQKHILLLYIILRRRGECFKQTEYDICLSALFIF